MTDGPDDDQVRAFAEVGRDLLSFELETAADDLYYEFRKASKKARNADRITEAAARRLAHALEHADMFVDSFYARRLYARRGHAMYQNFILT